MAGTDLTENDQEKETDILSVYQKRNFLKYISDFIASTLESTFSRLGEIVGSYPWMTICICLVVVIPFGLGLVRFTESEDPYSIESNIWIPEESAVTTYKKWVKHHFPKSTRFVSVIFTAKNILSLSSLNAMLSVYKTSLKIATSGGHNFSTLCVQYGHHCLVNNILEVWRYNENIIKHLTEPRILSTVNEVRISPVFYNDLDVTTILGDIYYSNKSIVSAKAAKMTWILRGDTSTMLDCKEWEKKLISIAKSGHPNLTGMFVYASRTVADEGGGAMQSSIYQLSGGYCLVFLYVATVLGKFNCVENKIGLALCGLVVIGLSILFSFGLASAIGWEYGPVHSALAFLVLGPDEGKTKMFDRSWTPQMIFFCLYLIGVGVDNIFVINGTLSSFTEEEKQKLPLPAVVARILKHAGVSITVTSLTDILAFGTGATTIIPALRSFCVFAVLAIMALYVLSSTFFMAGATFILKVARMCRNNSKCVPKEDKFEPTKYRQISLQQHIMEKYYAPLLTKLPVKVLGLFLTLLAFCFSILGVFNLEQDFNPAWFLPEDSYGRRYIDIKDRYFPHDGQSAAVYCGAIDYFNSKSKFETLYYNLSNSEFIAQGSVESWYKSFTDWLTTTSSTFVAAQLRKLDENMFPVDENTFMSLLQWYLTKEPSGLRHFHEVRISSAPFAVNASFIKFQHRIFNSSKEEITAMDNTQSIIHSIFGGECFAYSEVYNLYETNRVIQSELYRNLGIALCCVFVITLLLIANVATSLMVFSCVFFTLINVGGFLHFMGLTIDTCTSIILILSVGLAVDYSEHIGVCFMRMSGSRNERVKATLSEMGVAVFNGGISTFLAFIVVAFSKSYVFTTFFKVFLLIVVFGLFHGLVYLPIILSLFGPKPHKTAYNSNENINYETEKTNLGTSQTETTLLSEISTFENDDDRIT